MLRRQPIALPPHCVEPTEARLSQADGVVFEPQRPLEDPLCVENNALKAELSTPSGCTEAVRSGMLQGPQTMAGRQFDFRKLGFDDHPVRRLPQRHMTAMLSSHPRAHAAAESSASNAAGSLDAGAIPEHVEGATLDPAALARLAELDPQGTNRLIERVLQAFQASVARLRPQLQAARLSGDRAPIRLVAHTLKSSSASIGALRLSALCARIEAAIRLDSCEHLDADLDSMDIALDEAIASIEQFLKDRA
jgi:HPt (histidine-containing phosphotransfer) domain-containing protein